MNALISENSAVKTNPVVAATAYAAIAAGLSALETAFDIAWADFAETIETLPGELAETGPVFDDGPVITALLQLDTAFKGAMAELHAALLGNAPAIPTVND
jgi:hypothetical protein